MTQQLQGQPVDDHSIDGEVLLRRILNPDWIHTEADGSHRPQSVAMIDRHTDEVSVYIASLAPIAKVLGNRTQDCIIAFPAKAIRELGGNYMMFRDPADPSHVLITPSVSRPHSKKLFKRCEWKHPPGYK
jgi:hypothetical protein